MRPGAEQTGTNQPASEPDATEPPAIEPTARGRVERIRAVAGVALIVLVVAAAVATVYKERHSFFDTLSKIGIWYFLLSFVPALIGVGAAYPTWRAVLGGLGVDLPWRAGARVFFVSQLGKYLPGSVWPVLMQMEAGRARGASRRTMLAANLITLVMSCAIGVLLAAGLLPFYDSHVLTHYWWVLLAVPFLLALLHPRAIPALLDWLFGLIHRPPLGERLEVGASARASGFALVNWLGQGLHLAVLCVALGHNGVSTYVLCIGGMALAVSAGILFIPAPAGAGPRDIILRLVLGGLLASSGQALAVAVASRVILIAVDLVLAAVASLLPREA